MRFHLLYLWPVSVFPQPDRKSPTTQGCSDGHVQAIRQVILLYREEHIYYFTSNEATSRSCKFLNSNWSHLIDLDFKAALPLHLIHTHILNDYIH